MGSLRKEFIQGNNISDIIFPFPHGMRKLDSNGVYDPIVFPNRLTKNCYPFSSRVSITNQIDDKNEAGI